MFKRKAWLWIAVVLCCLVSSRMWAIDEKPQAITEKTAEHKPVAVISLSGYDRLLGTVSFLGELGDNPGIKDQIEGMLTLFTQGEGLKGLDKSKPWGAVIQSDGLGIQPLVFVPVSGLKELLGVLAGFVGEPTEEGDGILSFAAGPGGQQVFLKEQAGWAYLAQSKEHLGKLPADPAKLLGGLDKEYDVAVRVHVQNIPEMIRTMWLDTFTQMADNLPRLPDEEDAAYESRQKMTLMQMERLVSIVKGMDQFTLGWRIDREKKVSYLDGHLTALPNSLLAKQLATVQEMPSDFSGFMQDSAAAALNQVGMISKEDFEAQGAQIDTFFLALKGQIDKTSKIQENDKEVVKSAVGDLIEVAKGTLQKGKFDLGASLVFEQLRPVLVAGVAVAEPKKAEAAILKLAEVAKKNATFTGEIQLNSAKHAAVQFHRLRMPVPEDEVLSKFLGKELDLSVGFGSRHIYLAVGPNHMQHVQEAMNRSVTNLGNKVLPFQFSISLDQWFAFASSIESNPILGILAQELSKVGGRNHVSVVARTGLKDGGVGVRLTIEEGVLRLIGQAGKLATGGPPGGAPPDAAPAAEAHDEDAAEEAPAEAAEEAPEEAAARLQ